MNKHLNLQLFADAGTLVNTSVNYANAYAEHCYREGGCWAQQVRPHIGGV